MSLTVLDEHLAYWRDEVKVDRYRRALAEVVRPGDRVLDLGSGTGLLGLLACEAGAGHVIAVESGPMAAVAQEVFERNGVADRVEVHSLHSTELALAEHVDVIIGDQIGGFAYSAGTFEFYADAAKRLLSPGGITVPSSFDLVLAAVEHGPSRTAIDGFSVSASGHDLTPLHELTRNSIRTVRLDVDGELLSAPQVVHQANSTDDRTFTVNASLEIERRGRVDGLGGMFTARLSPTVRMSNVPGDPDQLAERWQDLFPLTEPIEVNPGDELTARVTVNPRTYLATWQVAAGDLAGATRHSSFYSRLLTPRMLRQLTRRPTSLSGVGRLVAATIAGWEHDHLDVDALVAHLAIDLPHLPRTRLERVVRSVTTALSEMGDGR